MKLANWAGRVAMGATMLAGVAAVVSVGGTSRVAAGGGEGGYRVLRPIQSGDLTLFPVVRADGKGAGEDRFLTLDAGLHSGEVEVTESGRVRGLVRSRGGFAGGSLGGGYGGDQVNTLVLVNHSNRPLLLLAGEIVTGGKQDRVIAKDRIVPPGADPIDLAVFCIEHGRWTESSAKFGASAAPVGSFMVQPSVRQQAMVAKDQQGVWNSVDGAISSLAEAAAPRANAVHGVAPGTGPGHPGAAQVWADGTVAGGSLPPLARPGEQRGVSTTSYAKAMKMDAISAKVDEEGGGLAQFREQALVTLRGEHAVGVVVAVRGEVIWADLFSDPQLLERYWVKLVRSYAAEGVTGVAGAHSSATVEEAQQFLATQAGGREESEGEVGVYRYREVKSGGTDTFALESLLPGTGYDVHVSKLKVRNAAARVRGVGMY